MASPSDAIWLPPALFLAKFAQNPDSTKWIAASFVGFVLGLTNPALKNWFVKTFPDVQAFKRPQGAMNCEIDNSGGDQAGQPGFPSGHMTIMAYYVALYALFEPNIFSISLAFAGIGWMAYARRFCHTVLQRAAGTLFGLVAAFLTFYLSDK